MEYKESIGYYSDGDKDHDLYLLFTRARYLVFRARERELQRYQLSPEQAQILFIVHALKDKATPAEISRFILREHHTVSTLVERMEAKGLVKRVKDLEPKNLVRIAITEEGERCYALTAKRGPIHRIMGALNDEEREQFQKYLQKIMAKAGDELHLNPENQSPDSD
jgi:MarR family transcriptional regulator, organic hydroperoxide resistance regulator